MLRLDANLSEDNDESDDSVGSGGMTPRREKVMSQRPPMTSRGRSGSPIMYRGQGRYSVRKPKFGHNAGLLSPITSSPAGSRTLPGLEDEEPVQLAPKHIMVGRSSNYDPYDSDDYQRDNYNVSYNTDDPGSFKARSRPLPPLTKDISDLPSPIPRREPLAPLTPKRSKRKSKNKIATEPLAPIKKQKGRDVRSHQLPPPVFSTNANKKPSSHSMEEKKSGEDGESKQKGNLVKLLVILGYVVCGIIIIGLVIVILILAVDWEDKKSKSGGDGTNCTNSQFTCTNGWPCLDMSQVCDVTNDCPGGEDEQNCEYLCSQLSDHFECSSGACIMTSQICDTSNDCGDYEDEIGCACTGGFNCSSLWCLPASAECDGYQQCPDADDELGCDCGAGETACGSGGLCILSDFVCDGVDDCPNGEDETCGGSLCTAEQFTCDDYSFCLAANQRCDQTEDCNDGSDEWDCFSLKSYDEGDIVLVYVDNVARPICTSLWQTIWADSLCQEMGFGTAISESSISTSVIDETSNNYLYYASEYQDSLLDIFGIAFSCSTRQVVTLTCSYDACGYRENSEVDETSATQGLTAEPGDWPWHVGIIYHGIFKCSGTLIARRWVLTATHCVRSGSAEDYILRMGSTYSTWDQVYLQRQTADSIFLHESFDESTRQNDIALIKLNGPITVTDKVRPICVADQSDTEEEIIENYCYTTGWGTLAPNSTHYPQFLHEARVEIANDVTCSADDSITSFDYDATTQRCAGYSDNFAATCRGDVGSPLVCRTSKSNWVQVGITSWNSGLVSENCGGYSVYTDVQLYSDWIASTMNS